MLSETESESVLWTDNSACVIDKRKFGGFYAAVETTFSRVDATVQTETPRNKMWLKN